MPFPHMTETGTHDLLARITKQQAAKLAGPSPRKQAHPAPQPPNAKTGATDRPAAPKKGPNITTIATADGSISYRVQIRGRVNGRQHSLCQSFSSPTLARNWRRRTQAEIELNGFPTPRTERDVPTVADLLMARVEKDTHLGRSARQQLRSLGSHAFWRSKPVSDLETNDIVCFAETMIQEGRKPQAVAGCMSMLAKTLKRARKRGIPVPMNVVEDGMDILWDEKILARSAKRERRPTLDELDQVLSALLANKRQKLPVAKIAVFALFSTRRIDEICRLRWDDLNEVENRILVRKMKYPTKKAANDVTVSIPPEAMRIFHSMPRTGEFIFPFKSRSVGTAFRLHRAAAGIVDLHFHDLRHEGISRLFEMGETDYFVRRISGHEAGGCVARYAHVQNKGSKYEDWPWLERVISEG